MMNPIIIDVTDTTADTIFWPPGMPYHKRVTRFYELELITGGAGKMTTEGKHYKTVRGDIYFRKPGVETQGIAGYYAQGIAFDPIQEEKRKRLYHTTIPYWITDENTKLEDYGFFDSYPDLYHTKRYEELEPLFLEITHLFQENRETHMNRMKLLMHKIFTIIDDELKNGEALRNRGNILRHYEKIVESKKYIDNNLEKHLSLEEIALQCGFSKNYYSKTFKEITGSTPFEYIIESRMLLARKLILTTNICIDQIVYLCGFDDRTYFYRIFKKHFNTTPALYRQKFIEETQK